MMRFSITLLLLIFLNPSALTVVADNDENNGRFALHGRHEHNSDKKQVNDGLLESAMRQLSQALLVQQQQRPLQQSFLNENSFSERLYTERLKRRILANPKKMKSIQEALVHLTGAHEQQQQKNMVLRGTAVARHLKAAISQMHSLLNNEKDNRRRRPLDTETLHVSETITGTAFETSVTRLAQALVANDDKSPAFLMHTAIVKQGIKAVIAKLHYALEENVNSFKEMQDLSKRMLLSIRQNNDPNNIMTRLADDPAAAASAVTSAIAQFLDETTTKRTSVNGDNGGENGHDTTLFDNLMTLLWILPMDTVVGSFVWSFAGLGSFRDEKITPLQSSIFDIEWIMDMIGCWAEKGILC